MTWGDALAPLRSARFAWYFGSRFVNLLGGTMAGIALTFAVLDLYDSAVVLGQVLAAHSIPMVLFVLFGGVVADRLPRTLVLQTSNLASAATQGLIAFLVLTETAELWQLLILTAVNGAVSAIAWPAMAAILPQLVPREQLQSANALSALARNTLTILGPTLGALIVVTTGAGWALAIDAATWLVAALLLLPIKIPRREPSGRPTSAWRELREGWWFFRHTTWLWVVVLAFAVINALHAGAWSTLGPLVAQDSVGRQGWGYVLSAEAVGFLVSSIVMLRLPLARPLLAGMLGMVLFGLPILVLGIHPALLALVAAAFLAGVGVEVFGIGWNLAMQENIEEAMLSRAFSYDMLGSLIAVPIGQLAAGPLADLIGRDEVLVLSGCGVIAASLLTLASRSVRTLPRVTAPRSATRVAP